MAKSLIGTLVPLVILFIVVVVGAAVAFVVYQIANEVADKTAKKMEKHNLSFGPDGMKVRVKTLSAEQVEDSTQGVLMKVWNNSSWPGYKSKLGWGQGTGNSQGQGAGKRQAYPRSSSGLDAKAK